MPSGTPGCICIHWSADSESRRLDPQDFSLLDNLDEDQLAFQAGKAARSATEKKAQKQVPFCIFAPAESDAESAGKKWGRDSSKPPHWAGG